MIHLSEKFFLPKMEKREIYLFVFLSPQSSVFVGNVNDEILDEKQEIFFDIDVVVAFVVVSDVVIGDVVVVVVVDVVVCISFRSLDIDILPE